MKTPKDWSKNRLVFEDECVFYPNTKKALASRAVKARLTGNVTEYRKCMNILLKTEDRWFCTKCLNYFKDCMCCTIIQ